LKNQFFFTLKYSALSAHRSLLWKSSSNADPVDFCSAPAAPHFAKDLAPGSTLNIFPENFWTKDDIFLVS
jgi:hypothetical protein